MPLEQVRKADSPEKLGMAELATTLATYAVTLGSMATVGVIVPQMARLSRDLGASMVELGFAIGLYSLPAALASLLLGAIIDRLGAKRSLLLAGGCALAADLAICLSATFAQLEVAMALGGLANAIVITAAPALLMTALAGRARVRAMSLWSTYGPAGYALGLLAGAPFADGGRWRLAVVCLMIFMTAAMVIIAAVFPPAERSAPRSNGFSPRAVIGMFGDTPLLRISLAYALAGALSYGSSLAAPGYLARVHGVSMASSATAIAAAKIAAMLLGGVSMGRLLGGGHDRRRLFVAVSALGLAAQILLYFPGSGMIIATAAMIAWLFAYGAISAISFVTLAQVNDDPARAGLVSGLIGQLAAIACVFAPAVYFAMDRWTSFVLVAAAGLGLGVLLFPRHRAPSRGTRSLHAQ